MKVLQDIYNVGKENGELEITRRETDEKYDETIYEHL